MKPKALWKMAVDLAMTVLLFCLMAYLLVGETAHEWLGVAMFGLFLLHHGLNGHWQHNLTKGRYTPMRVFQTVVDVLILLAMAGASALEVPVFHKFHRKVKQAERLVHLAVFKAEARFIHLFDAHLGRERLGRLVVAP